MRGPRNQGGTSFHGVTLGSRIFGESAGGFWNGRLVTMYDAMWDDWRKRFVMRGRTRSFESVPGCSDR